MFRGSQVFNLIIIFLILISSWSSHSFRSSLNYYKYQCPLIYGQDVSVSGTVNAIATLGNITYLGGNFTHVNGVERKNIAAFDASGTLTAFDPKTDASVNTIIASGSVLYAGGDFTNVGNFIDTSAVVIDATTNLRDESFPLIAGGPVYTSVPDGAGGWFIGGDFTSVSGTTRNRLARINADGSLHPFNIGVSSTVRTLALSDNMLYIGGDFLTVNGQTRNRIAKIDLTTPTGFLTTWNPNSTARVNSLYVSGTSIYVAGNFNTTIGGANRRYLAELDINSNTARPWNPNMNNEVKTIAVSGTTLYAGGSFTGVGESRTTRGILVDKVTSVFNPLFPTSIAGGDIRASADDGAGGYYIGGTFTSVSGTTRNRLARINADGSLHPFNPNVSGTAVDALIVSGTNLYVSGQFTNIAGVVRNNIAALDTTLNTNNATAWDPNVSHRVFTMALDNSTMYIGGEFRSVNGGQPIMGNAFLDSTTGNYVTTVLSNFNINKAVPDGTGGFFVGGQFTTVNGVARKSIARINADGSLNTDFTLGFQDFTFINDLKVVGSTLYVAGSFSQAGGQARSNIAAFDISSNTLLPWSTGTFGTGSVNTIEIIGNTLYAGGSFTSVAGQTRNRIAAFDLTQNTNNLLSWDPNVGIYEVHVFAASGTTLYVGGNYSSINGQLRRGLAALDTTLSTNMVTAWNPDVIGRVKSLLVSGTSIFVGGSFSSIGGQARESLAELRLDQNINNATAWNPSVLGAGIDGVMAMFKNNNTLYIGGRFNSVGGVNRINLAAVDTTTGLVLPFKADYSDTLSNIVGAGSNILVTGNGRSIGGVVREYIAAIDTVSSTSNVLPFTLGLSGSTNGGSTEVRDLLINNGLLYVAGSFTSVGGLTRNSLFSLNTASQTVTNWTANTQGGSARTMAVSGTTLYVGGTFSYLSGVQRNRLGAINTTLNTGNTTAWNPNGSDLSGQIEKIDIDGTNLYVTGNFTTIGNEAKNFIAKLDMTVNTNTLMAWGPALTATGSYLKVHGNNVLISGATSTVSTYSKLRLASFDLSTGNLNLNFDPRIGSSTVESIQVTDDKLYVAGNFSGIGGAAKINIGSVDGEYGVATSFGRFPQVWPGTVNTLLVSGSVVYAGGTMTTPRLYMTAYDVGLNDVISSFAPGVNGAVHALNKQNNKILIGGAMTTYSNSARPGLAAFDLVTSLALGWKPNINGSVNSIHLDGSTLYAGGQFNLVGIHTRNNIAALDINVTDNGATAWNPNADGIVRSIAVSGSTVYAGGDFLNFGGQARNRAGAVDTITGSATAWNPSSSAQVNSVVVTNDVVYLGGTFATVSGQSRNRLAAVAPSPENTVLSFNPNVSGTAVNSIAVSGSAVYVVGNYSHINGESRNNFSVIHKDSSVQTKVLPLNLNLNNSAMNVSLTADRVLVGGAFTSASGTVKSKYLETKQCVGF